MTFSACFPFSVVAAALAVSADLTSHDLSGNAKCVNGCPASVQAAVRDENLWVITLGGVSPSFNWCASGPNCVQFAKPPASCPTTEGQTSPLYGGGLQNPDCKENPVFCGASHGIIGECDFALFLGDSEVDQNGTTLHFRGRSILSSAIQKLAALGMAKATHVLLTGLSWSGTAAILNADYIGTLLKANVPGLQTFKMLPVDAMHPDFRTMFCESGIMKENCKTNPPPTWLKTAQQALFALTNAQSSLPAGCGAECMYMGEAIKHVQTPMFIVQQMPGVWDMQCNFEGQPTNNILQVACSIGGNYFRSLHACTQYSDLCEPDVVRDYIVPLQQKYLSDVGDKPGFIHSCYLGDYFNSPPYNNPVLKQNTSWWNQIQVDGKNMRQALEAWWTTGATTQFKDLPWNPNGTPPGVSSGVGTPIVPWYTNRFMQNPTCRGDPWYLTEKQRSRSAVIV